MQSPGVASNSSKDAKPASIPAHHKDSYSLSPCGSKDLHVGAERTLARQSPSMVARDGVPLNHDFSDKISSSSQHSEIHLPSKFGDISGPSQSKDTQITDSSSLLENNNHSVLRFDICPLKTASPVVLKPSLLVKNRERRKEIKSIGEGKKLSILRSGMVLIKSCITLDDQVLYAFSILFLIYSIS